MSNSFPEIIFEDEYLLVIKKPAGFATQSAKVGQQDCVSFLKTYMAKSDPGSGNDPFIGVIHRLDQPVAGLLVFAKTKSVAAALSRQVREGLVNKHYVALVEGIVDNTARTELSDLIGRDPKTKNAFIACDASAASGLKKARLLYKTEKIYTEKGFSLLSVDLITGRYHQIRAQLSHAGHPIVGDRRYGASSDYPEGIALAADRLDFIHPVSGEKVEKTVDFSFCL